MSHVNTLVFNVLYYSMTQKNCENASFHILLATSWETKHLEDAFQKDFDKTIFRSAANGCETLNKPTSWVRRRRQFEAEKILTS